MVSIASVINDLAEAQGRILILMQEGDEGHASFTNMEWADEMFYAYTMVKNAINGLKKAEDWE